MARPINKLSARVVGAAKEPGYYADGGGLYLQIAAGGTKSWIFRFTLRGRAREMGLGPLALISLADARARAQACRLLLHDGLDPIEHREEQRRASADVMTFGECKMKYIEAHSPSWKNKKHKGQWEATLATYAGDLDAKSVDTIDTAAVLSAIEPIWRTKTETATRVRQRIEAILDWATARKMRSGENPARWRGHLDKLLPAANRVRTVRHHAAMHYSEVAGFIVEVRKRTGLSAYALELQTLTALRPNEVCGAKWEELDLDAGVWTVPAERMKKNREHRVPLSSRAIELLQTMPKLSKVYVFPGDGADGFITTASLLKVAQEIRPGITVHGARSTFRDWAGDCTNYPRDLAEHALAHVLKDKTEAAYKRLDMLERRRPMMEEWALLCSGTLDHRSSLHSV